MATDNKGLIQGAANKAVQANTPKSPATRMRDLLSMNVSKDLMADVLRENKEAFVASLIDLYGSDATLAQCDPGAVLKEALKAVSLNLPINKQLGFAYIIPYRDKTGQQQPQFQMGYKGYIQLAQRTGAYASMNMDNVYEGELRVIDRVTGEIDLGGERISDKVVGYFAYIRTVNGFSKTLYWSMEKVVAHAKKYSRSYQQGASIWKNNFDEMAQKTVLRNLISRWGVMSTFMQTAMSEDNADLADQAIVAEDATVTEITPIITTDPETGEVIVDASGEQQSVI